MDLATAIDFARPRRQTVLTTIRDNGQPQLSNVIYTVDDDGVFRDLHHRHPGQVQEPPEAPVGRAAHHRRGLLVLRGASRATPSSARWPPVPTTPSIDELVDLYRAVAGEHPDWDEYRKAMVDEQRSVLRVRPTRAYGMVRLPRPAGPETRPRTRGRGAGNATPGAPTRQTGGAGAAGGRQGAAGTGMAVRGPLGRTRASTARRPPTRPRTAAAMVRLTMPAYIGFIAMAAAVRRRSSWPPGPSRTTRAPRGSSPGARHRGRRPDAAHLGELRRFLPLWGVHLIALRATSLVTAACFAVGVSYSPFAAALAWVVLGTVDVRHRQTTGRRSCTSSRSAVCYALVVTAPGRQLGPAGRWFAVMGIVALTGITVSGLVERTRLLARGRPRGPRRRARRARRRPSGPGPTLADLNATLEARVIDQVDELGRLNGLRRFLSAPVAEPCCRATSSVLEPHRRQIAVLFCDLRGFTSFASGGGAGGRRRRARRLLPHHRRRAPAATRPRSAPSRATG